MRYLALATDYDGTLATDGHVSDAIIEGLERFRTSGRRLLLVTGRELDDLLSVFDRIELFDRVVAENGAVLYRPDTKERVPLCDPPPPAFVEELHARTVSPLSVGDVIVATWRPHETQVLDAIASLGLDLQVIFNKGAVMVLPAGVTKATGLRAALDELHLSEHNVVGVGDAENDHAFLDRCELSVAVANALPAVQRRCDHVTVADHGGGVLELIDAILDDDATWRPERHAITFATDMNDAPVTIDPFGETILITGPSASGKSTTVTGILELLNDRAYELLIVDPEGDYGSFPDVVQLGDPTQPPLAAEIVQLLEAGTSLSMNLMGVRLDERPAFFESALAPISELLARTGRPHWMVIDEAHHLMPDGWTRTVPALGQHAGSTIFVTVHPDMLAPSILRLVTAVIAVGADPAASLRPVADALHVEAPSIDAREGCIVLWRPERGAPMHVTPLASTVEHHRHIRKYAAGDLADHAFVFTGPEGALRLRAQNLVIFSQMAEGVDDATWRFHLDRGDLVTWFRECVKDDDLATIAAEAASDPETSRKVILAAIEERYTAPATPSRAS